MRKLIPAVAATGAVIVVITLAAFLFSPPPKYSAVSCSRTEYTAALEAVYGPPPMVTTTTTTISHVASYTASTDTSGTAGQSFTVTSTHTGTMTGFLGLWNVTACTFVKG